MSSCVWWDRHLRCFERITFQIIMEHLEYVLAHNSRGLTWLYYIDINLQYRSFKGLRAQCLRPWLQDGWPSFRLAHTLLPLLTSEPLISFLALHEHHSLFFLIVLLTFYTEIGAFWCIYILFGSFMSHGLIDSSSSLFFWCPTNIFHHTSLFILFVLSFFFVITFLSMPGVMIFHISMHGGRSSPIPLLSHGHWFRNP